MKSLLIYLVLVAALSTRASASYKLDVHQYDGQGKLTRSHWNRQCSTEDLTRIILESQKRSSRYQGKVIEDYFKECEDVLTKGHSKGSLTSLLSIAFLEYEISENRFAKELQINLEDGTISRAVLLMKEDRRPRPLVIAKCGSLCNLGSGFGVNMLLAHLFDESPFHVLLVGNITGSEYQIDNGSIFFGGIAEGRQVIRLAQFLRSSRFEFADRISSVHAVGVSLGGHAQLFASIYNNYNLTERGERPLDSFVAMCPPVNLEASTQEMFSDWLLGPRLRRGSLITINEILTANPEMRSYFAHSNLKKDNLAELTAVISLQTEWKRAQASEWLMKPFMQSFENTDVFWRESNFLNQNLSEIQTPTLVLYSKNDPGIKAESNGDQLAAKLENSESEQLGVSSFRYGSHCALSASYDWAHVSALLRSYIISHSEHYEREITTRSAVIPWPASTSLSKDSMYLNFSWSAQVNSAELTLHLSYLNGNYVENTGYSETICRNYIDQDAVPASCIFSQEIQVPLTQLIDSNVFIPATETEARMLERWANANLLIKEKDGSPLKRNPALITWQGEP